MWVTGWVARSKATAAATKPSWSSAPAPARAQRQRMAWPPTWWSGRQFSHRSPGRRPRRWLAATAAASSWELPRSTARGWPSLPLVEMISAVSGEGGRCLAAECYGRPEKGPFSQAAGAGEGGQLQAVAGADQRRFGAVDLPTQTFDMIEPVGKVVAATGADHGRRLRHGDGGVLQKSGERGGGCHKLSIIELRCRLQGEADQ